jgi:hypothetical protein
MSIHYFFYMGTTLLWLFYSAPAHSQAPQSLAQTVQQESDLSYSTSFTWQCSPRTWENLIENPSLLAALWQAYGYAPSYQVSVSKDILHVVDSTGLEGEVHLLETASDERTYLVHGKLNHWAVPFFNQGQAVFRLRGISSDGQVKGTIAIDIKATSGVASAAIKLASPLVRARVDNRVTLNLIDVQRIVEAIEATPDSAAAKLEGAARREFTRLFQH